VITAQPCSMAVAVQGFGFSQRVSIDGVPQLPLAWGCIYSRRVAASISCSTTPAVAPPPEHLATHHHGHCHLPPPAAAETCWQRGGSQTDGTEPETPRLPGWPRGLRRRYPTGAVWLPAAPGGGGRGGQGDSLRMHPGWDHSGPTCRGWRWCR
jgi:hypothetical protein